eukprot:TRINITY_DN1235_c0_g1_i1.p1 TRINITY_DN1235_c0_g1~~TRINITY_DN1235_c0_g1_i1.p1  ORF type:complete len:394 (-),score=86.19 TRINITY_DN1235_c0_g1_i1:48-1229(-)
MVQLSFQILVLLLQTTLTTTQFVQRSGTNFVLNSKPYRFGGTNCYYLAYENPQMVDNLFQIASQNNFQVIRTWAEIDIGNKDGSNSIDGKKNGIYFHFWNGTAPDFNDGSDGLEKLDYVLSSAKKNGGIRLILSLTNNWSANGGMDQYIKWKNGKYHDEFYTDPTIKTWFKNWIYHLLTRVNSLTGIAYKDDPIIFGWELANEPRCTGSGAYPASPNCQYQKGADLLSEWVTEISDYIKSIDGNHMIAVGDEGFPCFSGASVGWDWTLDCYSGVDTIRFSKSPSIDFMTAHLYPSSWGKTSDWGTEWIFNHTVYAKSLVGKPFLLEEFGVSDKSVRDSVYLTWTNVIYNQGGNGFLFWMLANDNYPDYDGFTLYCPSSDCKVLSDQAKKFEGL